MITLSNGHSFEYMVASGALGFDGLGWPWEKPLVKMGLIKPELFTVVLKSLTKEERRGNLRWWKPWDCVRLIPGGSVNKVGLTNPGIYWWWREVVPYLDYQKNSLVGSMFGELHELVEMTQVFNEIELKAIEVNPSCPNTGHVLQTTQSIINCVRAVKEKSRHPVLVKVSVDQDYLGIAHGVVGFAEAISLNSVNWSTVFPNKQSPLHRLERRVGGGGGGVSGKPAQHFNWEAVKRLALQKELPVIGPSVMEYEDMARLRELGASAISFGAIHLRTPWNPTAFVQRELGL